jgi:hypothetical protein
MLEAGHRLCPAANIPPAVVVDQRRCRPFPRTEDRDKLAATIGAWKAAGASHLSVNTMKAGFANVDEHLAALEQVTADLT